MQQKCEIFNQDCIKREFTEKVKYDKMNNSAPWSVARPSRQALRRRHKGNTKTMELFFS